MLNPLPVRPEEEGGKIASEWFKDMPDSLAGAVSTLSEDAPKRSVGTAPTRTEGVTIPRSAHNRNLREGYRNRIRDAAGLNSA